MLAQPGRAPSLGAWSAAWSAAMSMSVALSLVLPGRATAAGPGARAPGPLEQRHVAVDLRFDLGARQAEGIATLTLVPRTAARQLALDAAGLTIHRVTDDRARLLRHAYDGRARDGSLVVHWPTALRPGRPIVLRVHYRTGTINQSDPNNLWGSTGLGLRMLGPSSVDPRRRVQVWASADAGSSRHWLPGLDRPDVLRSAEITATVAAPLQVVAAGRLVGQRRNDDGSRTFHWRIDKRHASHRTQFVVGEFVDEALRHGDKPLHNLGYADERAGVRASVERLPEMVRLFESLTGVALPALSYTQVFVQDLPWGHVGPGLAVQTENMVDDEGTHADYKYLWHGLQAESLAQQWFGVHLAVRDWAHGWLDRALAHHLAGLWGEHHHGRAEFLLWNLQFGHATYLADWQGGNRHPVMNPRHAEVADYLNGNHPYFHGAAVLNLLRMEVGDAAWRRALRGYVRRHGGGLVDTDDLRRAVEAAAGRPLDWFFRQWVLGIGHPVFEVSQAWDAQRRQLVLTVRQAQRPDPASPYPQTLHFQGHVDIDIDGRLWRRWLEPRAENRLVFDLPAEPRLVQFDHEGAWLKELRHDKTADELLHQFLHTDDTLGRHGAMVELVRRAQDPAAPAGLRERVQAALREVAARPIWWRVRFNVLQQLRTLLVAAAGQGAVTLDAATEALALDIVRTETGWLRNAALALLGTTRDARHAPLYIEHLRDRSDRVINAAALALGASGSADAFAALAALPAHSSWKNQSLISALGGLAKLKDARGIDIAAAALADLRSPRWTLATPVWDYRLAAAEALAALGAGERGTAIVRPLFEQALRDGDTQDVFSQLQLLVTLGQADTLAVFEPLRGRYAGDAQAAKAVDAFEKQLREKLPAGR